MPLSFIFPRMPNRALLRPVRISPRTVDFRAVLVGAVSIAWVAATPSLAHADRLAGTTLAQKGGNSIPACMTCHGAKGEGQAAAGFPRLAGQAEAYLLKQLQAFASGKRKNPQMAPIANALDTAQMRDVANYYASLPDWKQTNTPDTDSAQYAEGRKIATEGDWTKEMPACFACHGLTGKGIPPHFPALAGQPSGYTQAQLIAWKSARRTNDPQGLMQSVAEKMTPAEIAAVSLYFENPSFPGREK
ncbi:c-type cytochrome [Thiobacillus sp.]